MILLKAILVFLVFLQVTESYQDCENPVSRSMEENGIVPDVIDVAAREFLSIVYPGGKKVDLGNELTPTQVKDIPTVTWQAIKSKYYTLCMTDPDAPSRAKPNNREFLHWLVGNIADGDISNGEPLAAYIGSAPPNGTGFHRYTFLLYEQPQKLEFDEKRLPNRGIEGRPNFSIKRFAEKYHLGNPVAGNFYQAKWDEYVPYAHKEILRI